MHANFLVKMIFRDNPMVEISKNGQKNDFEKKKLPTSNICLFPAAFFGQIHEYSLF